MLHLYLISNLFLNKPFVCVCVCVRACVRERDNHGLSERSAIFWLCFLGM